jgi:hypothetical protein
MGIQQAAKRVHRMAGGSLQRRRLRDEWLHGVTALCPCDVLRPFGETRQLFRHSDCVGGIQTTVEVGQVRKS